jgi:hypothetical protein
VKRMKTFFGVRSTSDSRPQKETGSVSPINSSSEQVRRVKRKYVKSSHARWVKASENRVKRRREIEARLGISKPTKLNERESEKRGRGRPRKVLNEDRSGTVAKGPMSASVDKAKRTRRATTFYGINL